VNRRRSEDEIRQEHQIAHEDPEAFGPGRVFCSCQWASPVAPEAERMRLHAQHVDYALNDEEWCWGDPEKAHQRYYELENGVTV
jgi:hypothetical protein